MPTRDIASRPGIASNRLRTAVSSSANVAVTSEINTSSPRFSELHFFQLGCRHRVASLRLVVGLPLRVIPPSRLDPPPDLGGVVFVASTRFPAFDERASSSN